MGNSGKESNDGTVEFDSQSFFQRNSRLFTVLGVFGAISVYFTQLEVAPQWKRLGLVSSLSIFLLVAFDIYRGIVPEQSEKAPFDFLIQPQRDRLGLTLFAVPFFGIIAAVLALVVSYMGTITFLMQFVFLVAGISTVQWLVSLLEVPEGMNLEVGRTADTVYFLGYLTRNAMYGLILGSGFLIIALENKWITYESLKLLRGTSIPLSILSGYSAGLVIGSALYLFIAASVLFSHWMILRIRRKGQWDDFRRLYLEWFGNKPEESD